MTLAGTTRPAFADGETALSGTVDLERTLRPAAVLPEQDAALILTQLVRHDVSGGGVWNASATLWQRYDHPWDGFAGGRGNALLIGSIAIVYDSPVRHQITIYKVSMTQHAADLGWTVDLLCNDALAFANLTLEGCPRAAMPAPPRADPFFAGRVLTG
jgi:hypothetical protein